VLLLLAWLPLPWGSKPAAAIALFGFVAATLVVARLWLARHRAPLPSLPLSAQLALALWLAWLGWCALHGTALSILPGASFEQLLLGANYLALFWLVLVSVRRDRDRQRVLLTVLVFSGLAQALYGTIMTLSGIEYGFFEPKAVGRGWATGTFVNRNHLAGYLELTLAAGIALILADLRGGDGLTWRQRLVGLIDLALSPRMRTRVMIVAMVVALVLTRSRMGNVAFFAALAICANVYIFLRHPKYFLKSLLFFASLVVVDLLVVSEQYGLQKVAQRIEQTDLETEQRTVVFRELVPVIQQYWRVGSGPGTFAAAYAPHRSEDVRYYYDHAHNDYAEFLIETGIVGLGLLGALVTLTLAHAVVVMRRRRDPMAGALAFAAAMGLVSLGIHGLADFNLRIPAVAATLVSLMALTLSCSSRSQQRPKPAEPEAR
jgi:O-antigen ligase